MNTLLVLPLQEELAAFQASCKRQNLHWQPIQIGRLAACQVTEMELTAAIGGTGKAQFALTTQHLLDAGPSWDMVICAGAAGSLVDELAIGDVVVATSTIEHDYRNQFNARPLPAFAGAQQALTGLRQVSLVEDRYQTHFGPVASGDEDIIDPDRRKQLHEQTGALVAAWEGAGGARACTFSGKPFLEIRGVTDAANADAPGDFEANLEKAMMNVTNLITNWLRGLRARQ